MKTLLGGLLLLCSFGVFAMSTMSMTVSAKKNEFSVQLPANPTTGFQWSLIKFDKKLVKMTSKKYIMPKSNLIGAGGKMDFHFSLVSRKPYPQKTQMIFVYARGWEKNTSSTKQVTIHFKK